MRPDLPARRHPAQADRPQGPRRGPGDVHDPQVERQERPEPGLQAPGLRRGLRRLRELRRGLPVQGQGPQDGPHRRGPGGRRERQRGVLRKAPLRRPGRPQKGHHQRQPAPSAAVRVQRRLRRLRRNALCQAGHPALRRPDDRRQRHGLLVHLRRHVPDHALTARTRTAGARRGRTPYSRTTPNTVSG